ncbi:armadillo-type protein [Truncatella angustata]|uniref:Armadillo-type protein n=1 Tax=Truncatella angustata TaxID=152316 RepID=A0A9P8UKW0_9PEZI|nr:armadillo-type protein [Truncatella angustata]KAH6653979.1 armadillo-type protein [Truncatella angustata]
MPQVSVPVRPSRDQDPGKGIRSLLLEEFRKSHRNNKHYELKDIFGHVVEFSGDQHGSRFIQEKLKSANSDEKDLVFQEIKSNAVQLMKDVFGNYVIQKFFEHGSQVQKTVLTKAMKGKVADLSKQLYACRVVQTALEHVLVDQQEDIIEEIKPHLETIVKDNNGNHVVQKCMSVAPRVILPFIMATFRGSIRSISTNQFGCRVIQRIIDYGTLEEKRELMAEIHACAVPLIMDMFGNYVAQWVFESKDAPQEDKDRFANVVVEHLIEFSTNKCASNVVEKCLEFGTVDYRRAILTKLITADSKGRSPLDKIMLDQFGNYVIQKGIKHLEDQDRTKFLDEMERRFLVLNRNTDSRTIRQLGVIEKILEKYKQEREANAKTGSAQQAELHIDVHTTANTPALTSENSSPKSASSPSTKSGDETVAETGKATVDASLSINGQPEVVDVDGVVG